MNNAEIIARAHKQLFVSCQAGEGNPFDSPEALVLMAKAACIGGCVGFRANRPENVKAIKEALPEQIMVGIWKRETVGYPVYITPTMKEVDVLHSLGCEIIAIDGTDRINEEGKKAYELIRAAKKKYPQQLIMADLATLEDALLSAKAGADIIATTLSGYTDETRDRYALGADFALIKAIRKALPNILINAEGRFWTREEVKEALACGADFVTIGTAITNPTAITKRIVTHINA